MFLIVKQAMLDEKMNKDSISNYPVSSIQDPVSVGGKEKGIYSGNSLHSFAASPKG